MTTETNVAATHDRRVYAWGDQIGDGMQVAIVSHPAADGGPYAVIVYRGLTVQAHGIVATMPCRDRQIAGNLAANLPTAVRQGGWAATLTALRARGIAR